MFSAVSMGSDDFIDGILYAPVAFIAICSTSLVKIRAPDLVVMIMPVTAPSWGAL